VREVAEQAGIPWTQIVASPTDQDFIQKYAVEQIPAYFLIDPEGRLAHSGKGLPEAIRRDGPSVRRGWFRWLLDQVWGSDFGYA
jgi:hypothetical protein